MGLAPPLPPTRFYKLDFAIVDGSEDSLNWLNLSEQVFRGHHTLESDCVWLASYHLVGAAQSWYYALEKDEGMPHLECFKDLCHLRLVVRASRVAELVWLLFLSTDQEYTEHFNALLCYTSNLALA